MSGSHADSIELGGAYDGTVGVLGAVAALKGLQAAGFRPAASLEAVMFATEEAGRFNVPCLGRRVVANDCVPKITVQHQWPAERSSWQ